jgi:xanthine dehydrogenase accessory factor
MNSIFSLIEELQQKRKPFAVATVVETYGSVSAKTGSKAVIGEEGQLLAGWVGGGCAESTACQEAYDAIQSGNSTIIDLDLDDEVLGTGMPCGGGMRVYIEPVLPSPSIWLMGHGRVAEVICEMGSMLGYDVIVNDLGADPSRFPKAHEVINDDLDYAELAPKRDDYVVIATQAKGDHESMIRALACDAQYIALIASRKRSRLVMDFLQREGFEETDLKRVMAPSGMDLNPRTPEEIALCILSEITLVRRQGTGMRMKEKFALEQAQKAERDNLAQFEANAQEAV